MMPRNCRRCYLQCVECHNFILYDPHELGIATRPGVCPVCRAALNLKIVWRVGYVSRDEGEKRWTLEKPESSLQQILTVAA